MERETVWVGNYKESDVLNKYPELRSLANRKNKALRNMRSAESYDEFIAAHKAAKSLCITFQEEVNKRYLITV